MRKSQEEMLEDVISRLHTDGGVTETSPGSVARMFAEVIIEELGPIYSEIDFVLSMSFVSSSEGVYLDLIGELLGCKRNEMESDEDYRARIVNQVTVVQSANLTSIRIKALQVEGVADVYFKNHSKGAGSFSCYIVPQVFPVEDDLLLRVREELEEVIGYGISMEVQLSEYIPVDLDLSVIFNSQSLEVERDHIRHSIEASIGEYFESLGFGSPIIINEIIERSMSASEKIIDVEIKSLRVNSKEYFIKNVEPDKKDRYYARQINIA